MNVHKPIFLKSQLLFQKTFPMALWTICFVVVVVRGLLQQKQGLGSFKQQTFFFSQFCRLEVQKQSVGGALFLLETSLPLLPSGDCWHTLAFLGLQTRDSNLVPIVKWYSLCAPLFPNFSNLIRTLVIRFGLTLIQCDLILTWSQLPRTYLQVR